MPITCIAVDDEPPALEVLKSYAAKIPGLQLLQVFDDAISAGEFLRGHPVDLLLVDIQMPDITGLQLVKSLEARPGIIFTTAFKNYAHEGFELDAIDYLLKPISFERFSKAVQKATEYTQYRRKEGASENLFVYAEYRMVKIPVSTIAYIESLEDYIRIHLTSGSSIMTLMTLKGVLEKLPAIQFQRIHRSYIVATERVVSVQNRKARLQAGTELPISDSYTSFIQLWKNLH